MTRWVGASRHNLPAYREAAGDCRRTYSPQCCLTLALNPRRDTIGFGTLEPPDEFPPGVAKFITEPQRGSTALGADGNRFGILARLGLLPMIRWDSILPAVHAAEAPKPCSSKSSARPASPSRTVSWRPMAVYNLVVARSRERPRIWALRTVERIGLTGNESDSPYFRPNVSALLQARLLQPIFGNAA
jgi:hypothetical protein